VHVPGAGFFQSANLVVKRTMTLNDRARPPDRDGAAVTEPSPEREGMHRDGCARP